MKREEKKDPTFFFFGGGFPSALSGGCSLIGRLQGVVVCECASAVCVCSV